MSSFTARAHYSKYLAADEDTLWVVLTVKASESIRRTVDRAEVIIIDTSGSMGSSRKLQAAKGAADAAVDVLDDGVEYAVVTGNDEARKIWPSDTRTLSVASKPDRSKAHAAIASLQAGGGTRMGNWLDLARALFETSSAELRHAILLSDGMNTAGMAHLQAATEACRKVFQCDCRGFGTDWSVAELRYIAETLEGQVDLVDRIDEAGRHELAEHFESVMRDSQARVAPAVRLRVITRTTSDVVDCLQSTPTKVELADRGEFVESGPRATDFPTGGWAAGEVRDYTLGIRVRPEAIGEVGENKPVAKAELVLADGSLAAECLIRAEWTDDPVLSTRIEPVVAHHTKQRELADKIQAGLAAKSAGEAQKAATLLWQAREQAQSVGNDKLVARLDKLVRLDRSGNPRLLDASIADDMHADTESTESITFRGA